MNQNDIWLFIYVDHLSNYVFLYRNLEKQAIIYHYYLVFQANNDSKIGMDWMDPLLSVGTRLFFYGLVY